MLNLSQADSDEWRDDYGTMPEPNTIENPSFSICPSRSVKGLWMASPDYAGGAVIPIAFKVNGNRLEFTLPSLNIGTCWLLNINKNKNSMKLKLIISALLFQH